MTVHVLFKFAPNPYGGIEVDVTSNSGFWSDLSPFLLDASWYGARVFENLWQYSKVYASQVDGRGEPSDDWWHWHKTGFNNARAVRYPMGKGAKPLYLYYEGAHLSYVQARKAVYAPIYAELVGHTRGYGILQEMYKSGNTIVLRDYDAYDHIAQKRTLREVISDTERKCGHGFVLAMMLTGCLADCLV